MPYWVVLLAVVSLGVAALCAILILKDLTGHPQQMWIMNPVWPITVLYAGPLGLWAYYRLDAVQQNPVSSMHTKNVRSRQ